MAIDKLKAILNSVTPVETAAWDDFEAYFSVRTLRKNELLWKAGDTCKHLVYLQKGLVRSIHHIEDKEITQHFYLEHSVFYDDYSFVSQRPCTNTYEALEETILTVIPRAAVYLMFDKYKCFERLGRMMVEQNHIRLMEAQQQIKTLSAEEKYHRLIKTQPEIIQRVPLKIIASYLHMTPENLSRVRKKIGQ